MMEMEKRDQLTRLYSSSESSLSEGEGERDLGQ